MVPIRTLAGTLLLALTSTLPAQLMAFEMEAGRRSAGLFFWENGQSPGLFVIQYGTPPWKPEYAAMVRAEQAGTMRLGKDAWTTLDNSLPLQFGDTMLPVGHWYLAMHKDAEGGFHLAVFDSAKLRKARIAANTPDAADPDHLLALKMKQVDAMQAELRIAAKASEADASQGTLAIHWGNFQLSTPFQAVLVKSRVDLLRVALQDMAQLMEENKFLEFARRYAPPAVWEKMGEEEMAEAAKEFGEGDRATKLVAGLRTLLAGDLEVPDGENELDLEAEGLPGGKIPLIWMNGRWYIRD